MGAVMRTASISARELVVDFPIYGGGHRSLKKAVLRAATGGALARDADERVVVRALDELTFEFNDGDRVGLVGHNGAGKSTLLRVLAGAYEPVRGSLEVRGRVASMLSIWVGMDLEATGYENIHLRGTVMGMGKRRLASLVDEICEFTELGDFLNMPLRTYSSGMAMRLAFAVSTSVQADIVLMDEWLSVGDDRFSLRAQERLHALLDRTSILVLASHSRDLIRKSCNKVVLLEQGKIVDVGTPDALLGPSAETGQSQVA